jgi:hypothetical protein
MQMITVIREVTILPGKVAAARAYATEITEYVRDAHKLDIELLRPVGGSPMRVAWLGRHKDLAAYESAMNKMAADKRFAELTTRTSELWVPGTMQDQIWQGA